MLERVRAEDPTRALANGGAWTQQSQAPAAAAALGTTHRVSFYSVMGSRPGAGSWQLPSFLLMGAFRVGDCQWAHRSS